MKNKLKTQKIIKGRNKKTAFIWNILSNQAANKPAYQQQQQQQH